MYEPLLSPEKKHAEVGFYEEASRSTQKRTSYNQSITDKDLKRIDDEVQNELDEAKRWSFLMYKDFHNPLNPTTKELLKKCTDTLNEIDKLKNDLFHFYQGEKIKRLLTVLFEVLETLQKQLEMLYHIIESDGNMEKMHKLESKYTELGEFRLSIQNPSDICWKVLSNCLDYLIKNLLLDLHITMDHLFKKKGTLSNETKLNEIQILSGKIRIVTEYLPLAASFDKEDIFALEEGHPYLEELREHIEIKTLGPSERIKKSFKKFVKSIHVGMSALSKTSHSDSQFTKKLTISFGAMYYFFMPSEAQKQTNLFYSQPIEKTAWEAWNFLEDEFVLNMMKITLPSIKYARKVYINKMFESLKLESIQEALESQTLNTSMMLNCSTEPKNVPEEVTTLNLKTNNPIEITIKGLNKIPILIISDRNISIKKYSELDIAPKKNDGVARSSQIVGEKHIENERPRYQEPKPGFFNGLVRCLSPLCCFTVEDTEEEDSYFDGIVVHFHGGGFVSMSSGSHQSYTRQWSKKLKKPVFSVDYRLAPENPYPAALDDCWQAYNWIINYSQDILGVKPNKIILAGDSAGGNLALGVAVLAIKCGVRVPDGLFLAYPALRLEPKAYSPSLMLALEDQLVPYSLLRLCLQAYVPNGADPAKDPLLSPVLLSNDLLEKLPPIRMMVGDTDPLHDECWRFTDKLRKLNKDVHLTVYKDMCHGFLGYDVPMGMPESKICIEDSVTMISELLNKQAALSKASSADLGKNNWTLEKEGQSMY